MSVTDSQAPTHTIVAVPDGQMGTEPAKLIAKTQEAITALIGLLAVAGIIITPELADNLELLVQSGIAVAFGVYAVWSNWRQGQKTHDAVYAPDTVSKVARSEHVEIVRAPATEARVTT